MADWQTVARRKAQKYGLDPNTFVRQIRQESGGRDVRSPAGAQGPAQFMPGTAASVGLNSRTVHQLDPSLDAAAKLMASYVRKFGSYRNALVAYNAGPGAVGRGSLPAETRNYINVILGGRNPSTSGVRRSTGASGGGGGGGRVRTIPGRPGSTRTESTTTVIPGVDNRLARASLIQSFLDDHSSIDPLDFAVQARQLQDVAPSSTTETRTFRTPGTPGRTVRAPGGATPLRASSFGAGNGPAGRRGPVAHMTSEGGPHATDGLAGFPARDYFAHPGSAAVAPINGRVVRLSGHDPSNGPTNGPHGPLGWSVYIQGDDGHTYFLTHMGSRSVKPGQRVRAGQKIGTVANYDKYGTPSHIHMGVH